MCAKRLERGRFHWPKATPEAQCVTMRPEELAMLLSGLDLAGAQLRKNWFRQVSSSSFAQSSEVRIVTLERELSWAMLKIQVLEPQLRQERIRRMGPHSEELSDLQLKLLHLEPMVTPDEGHVTPANRSLS